MSLNNSEKFTNKAQLIGRICPVWVADPDNECRLKPRKWGYITLPFVQWYCVNIINQFPIVYRVGDTFNKYLD